MINVNDVTILNDIRDRLLQVTPDDIAGSSRRPGKVEENEKVLGRIERESTKAVWALFCMLGNEMGSELVKAHAAYSEELENDYKQRAAILDELRDVVRELFWAQVRSDLGLWSGVGGEIGMRKDWVIVEMKSENDKARVLKQIFGIE